MSKQKHRPTDLIVIPIRTDTFAWVQSESTSYLSCTNLETQGMMATPLPVKPQFFTCKLSLSQA